MLFISFSFWVQRTCWYSFIWGKCDLCFSVNLFFVSVTEWFTNLQESTNSSNLETIFSPALEPVEGDAELTADGHAGMSCNSLG